MCLSVHRCICVEKKTQLDGIECFIALMIRSTCFGHLYAHHQELEIILYNYRLWCTVLGCWLSGVRCRQRAVSSGRGMLQHPSSWTQPAVCTWPPTTSNQALHTIGGNYTHIVSSSWWWTQKCPKHVEHIISAIKHSVTSSWYSCSTHNLGYIWTVRRHIERAYSSGSKRNGILPQTYCRYLCPWISHFINTDCVKERKIQNIWRVKIGERKAGTFVWERHVKSIEICTNYLLI